MATPEQQLLSEIARNTERTSGEIAKMVGMQRQTTTGGRGERGENGDLLSSSTKGFTQSLKKLKQSSEELSKSQENLKDYNENHRREAQMASRELRKLQENFKDQVSSGKNLLTIRRENAQTLENLSKLGVNLGESFKRAGVSFDELDREIQKTIDAKREERLTDLRAVQANARTTQKMHQEARESFQSTMDSFAKAVAAAGGVFAARGSSALNETLRQGFRTGGISGAFEGMVEGIGLGISPEEAMRFVNQNRNTLLAFDSVSNALVSADQGISAVDQFMVDLNTTFGLRGDAALQAASQSLNLFANTGTRISQEGLMEFNDAIKRVADASELTGDQLISEFSNLAEDSDFQSFFLSLGDQGNLVNYLSDSFLNLQQSVGMNINEFIEYRKTLARERQRTGTERVVQGAFTQQLGWLLGFGAEQADLLRRGATFYESLSEEERREFDTLRMEAGRRLTEERGRLVREGRVAELQQLDIVAGRSVIQEQAAMEARDRAGLGADVVGGENQRARIEAANQNTEAIVELNETIRRLTEGFLKSPFGGAAAAIGALATQLGSGIVAAMIAQKAGNFFNDAYGDEPDSRGRRKPGRGMGRAALGRLGAAGAVLGTGFAAYEVGSLIYDTFEDQIQGGLRNVFGDGSDPRLARINAKTEAELKAMEAMVETQTKLAEEKKKEQDAQTMAQIALLEKQLEIQQKQYEELREKPPEKFSIAMDD
jgi:hypothetical protein